MVAGLGELFITHGLSKKVVVLFDEHTQKLYGDELLKTLAHQGFQLKELVVPAREASKSFSAAYRLYGSMIEADVDRSWNLLAVGGGAGKVSVGSNLATGLPKRVTNFSQIKTHWHFSRFKLLTDRSINDLERKLF